MHHELVAVTSRSFSKNRKLRTQLQQHYSDVRFNEQGIKLTDNALLHFLKDADRAIIGLEKIDDTLLGNLPKLKAICKVGTGIDKIDLPALTRRGVQFCATPGLNKRSVSELVLGLIFVIQRNLMQVYHNVRQGIWQQPTGSLLSNKIVGIIGFGAIGQDLAVLLHAFNCKCLVYDVQFANSTMDYAEYTNFEDLLRQADIVSLHIPLNADNYHFLSEKEFSIMKKSSIIINTARGGLIDEKALYHALKTKHIAAAALDVFEDEPEISHQLLALDNFFATSHIGGSTHEAIEAMGMMAIDKLINL